jgi:hypothetical protein
LGLIKPNVTVFSNLEGNHSSPNQVKWSSRIALLLLLSFRQVVIRPTFELVSTGSLLSFPAQDRKIGEPCKQLWKIENYYPSTPSSWFTEDVIQGSYQAYVFVLLFRWWFELDSNWWAFIPRRLRDSRPNTATTISAFAASCKCRR